MPLEIRELVIQANLGGRGKDSPQGQSSAQNADGDQNEMIQACVEAVLEIIKQKSER